MQRSDGMRISESHAPATREENGELAQEVSQLLTAGGVSLSTAESCTGGAIATLLTSIPGASEWFAGGIVAYANGLKISLLGVPESVIRDYGAVSSETALAMAEGVRKVAGTDLGISVTGVAGPGGGTRQKPVGTVFMALCSRHFRRVWHMHFEGDREVVRSSATGYLLQKLVSHLRGEDEDAGEE
jgi:PncC family amidohydrolase